MSGGAFVFLPTRAREGGGCGRWARARRGRRGRARGGGARGWVGGLTARGSGRTVGVNSSRDSRKARTSSSLMPSIPGTSGRVLGGLASSPGGGAVGASAAPGASVDVIEREGRTREDAEARRGKWRARKRGWRTSRARRKAMVIEISRGSPVLPVPADFKARAVSSRPPAGGLSNQPRQVVPAAAQSRGAPRGAHERAKRDRSPDANGEDGDGVRGFVRRAGARAAPRLRARGACRRRARGALLSRHHLGGCVSAAGPDDRATARRGPGRGRGRHRGRGGKTPRRRASPTPTPPARARVRSPARAPPPHRTVDVELGEKRPPPAFPSLGHANRRALYPESTLFFSPTPPRAAPPAPALSPPQRARA